MKFNRFVVIIIIVASFLIFVAREFPYETAKGKR
jgi:hypothetical protein